MAKGWGKEINAAWDEADHPRGKTTEESNSGSFAPKGGGGAGGAAIPGMTVGAVLAHKQQFRERMRVNAPGGTEFDRSYDAAGSRDGVYAANVSEPPPIGAGVKGTSYKPRDKVEVGAILYSSWGYDQTNIDFYEVTGMSKSGKTATLRQLAQDTVEDGFLSGHTRPRLGEYTGKTLSRRVSPNNSLRISDYAGAYLWDGTDKAASWGH